MPVPYSVDPRPEDVTYTPSGPLEGELPTRLWPTLPVACRDDFAPIAQRFFNLTGWAAEIGVYQGKFAQKNLQHWLGRYYMIDLWQSDEDLFETVARTRVAGSWKIGYHRLNSGRAWIMRSLSVSAASRFANGAFDWIYIDASHHYRDVLADLVAWYPKVRQGGLISGDDYGDATDVPYMTVDRYEKALNGFIGREGAITTSHMGTIRAVNEFARLKGHQLFVTFLPDCHFYPNWYFVKA